MKKIRTLFLTTVIFFLSTILIYAQQNFRKATVVTLQGDSIPGEVNYQQWAKNPGSITFRREGQTTVEKLYPSSTRSVYINATDYYESAIVHVDRNYSQTFEISKVYSRDTSSKDTVFLRAVVKAKLSLYLFTDENNKEHFYATDDSIPLMELIYKKVPVSSNQVVTVSKYKNQLHYLMKSCSQLSSKIDHTDYSENPLLKLFQEYNQCISYEGPAISNEKDISKVTFHLIAGLDIAQLTFVGGDYYSHLELGKFSTSYKPLIGLRMNIPFNRNREKLSLVSDLSFRQYDTKAEYSYTPYSIYSNGQKEYQIHLGTGYIKLDAALRYKYPSKKFQPYISGGLMIAYLVRDVNEKHEINLDPFLSPSYPRETDGVAFEERSKTDNGYFGSLGLHYQKFSFEIKFEKSAGLSNYIGLISSIETYYFIFSYQLSQYR